MSGYDPDNHFSDSTKMVKFYSKLLYKIDLIFATGAGAVSRYNIGLVIATGIAIGTLFTLFVVPAMYMFLADDIQPKPNNI